MEHEPGEVSHPVHSPIHSILQFTSPCDPNILDHLVEVPRLPPESLAQQAIETAEYIPNYRHNPGLFDHSDLFWIGTLIYRLPATCNQIKYLMIKIPGIDEGIPEDIIKPVQDVAQVLQFGLIFSGVAMSFCTRSDPLVLLVAMGEPGYISAYKGHLLSDYAVSDCHLYYFTSLVSLIRVLSSPSVYAGPIVTLKVMQLLTHILVDTGYVEKDHYFIQFTQSSIGLVTERIGLMFYPDLPIKLLQGLSLVAEGIHCIELTYHGISDSLFYLATADSTIVDHQEDFDPLHYEPIEPTIDLL